ncbi:MAG TPA: collagen-binding domain-containing protein [Isosphaeraceae bacterium]
MFTLRSVILAAAAAILVGLSAESARAGYDLGLAANYGVLANPGTHNFQLSSDDHITGNIGVLSSDMTSTGTNNNIKFANATVTGRLDLQGTNTNGIGGTATGGVFTGVSDVLTAYNTLTALASTEAGKAGTTIVYSGTGGTTIAATNGTPDGNGNNVFTTTAAALSGSLNGTLTVSGTASQYVVINITGTNQNFQFTQGIALSGGITDDHVLLNFTGTGSIQVGGSGHGATLHGDILAFGYTFNMDNVTVDGRVFGGDGSKDFQIVSGFNLNQPVNVPEPSSLALVALGGGACLAIRRRRARRR